MVGVGVSVCVGVGVGLSGVGVTVRVKVLVGVYDGVRLGVGVYVLVRLGVGLFVCVGDGETGGPGSHDTPLEQLPKSSRTTFESADIGLLPQTNKIGSFLSVVVICSLR